MRPEFQKYIDVIDVEDALVRMYGSKHLYAQMLNMFLGGQEMEKFEAAVSENKLGKAGEYIHTLKGVAGNLSLRRLFAQSEHISQKLRLGETVDDPHLFENFRETYALTRSCVQALIEELNAE